MGHQTGLCVHMAAWPFQRHSAVKAATASSLPAAPAPTRPCAATHPLCCHPPTVLPLIAAYLVPLPRWGLTPGNLVQTENVTYLTGD